MRSGGARPVPVSTAVAIIGAGQYGLSIAAHLRARGIDFRIFGKPMHSWREQMPAGMFLKSEGFASSLSTPDADFTLARFCADEGHPYSDTGTPVARETFVDYGLAFQRRYVPDLETRLVTGLDRRYGRFELRLEDGTTLTAGRAVVATGLTYFRHLPPILAGLPASLLTHSSEHHDLRRFEGRHVTVIGSGASALDLMAELQAAGADAQLVTRRSRLAWTMPAERAGWKRWLPKSGLGPGWRNRFYAYAPMLFRALPAARRRHILRTWLGPSGSWTVKDRVERMPLLLGYTPQSAEVSGDRVLLRISGPDAAQREIATDHVIAATGYRVDLQRLSFFAEGLAARVQAVDAMPVLSGEFQSSVPGLYFVGLASGFTFGPLMRFVLGTDYTARRIARHLAGAAR